MAKRRAPHSLAKITITVPEEIVEKLDELAEEFEGYVSRSEIVTTILEGALEDEDFIDELFPEED
jgi:metal-responsive CopG/Arc/MetJ family transcriptional regulator